jgi:hypothetical protein
MVFVLTLFMTNLCAAAPTERTYALYALMACAIVLLTIAVRRRRREGFGNLPKTPRQKMDELAARQGVRDDMQALLAELQDLARKINAQIDTKFAKLEAAISDADRRIEALQRLTRAARSEPALDVTVGDEPSSDGPPPQTGTTEEGTVAARHAAVYQLADTGKSPVEIAQTLGRTPGEIELILALRSKN